MSRLMAAEKVALVAAPSWSMGAEGAVSVPHETRKLPACDSAMPYLSSSHLAVARPNRTISALVRWTDFRRPPELAGVGRRLNLLSPLLPQRPRHW